MKTRLTKNTIPVAEPRSSTVAQPIAIAEPVEEPVAKPVAETTKKPCNVANTQPKPLGKIPTLQKNDIPFYTHLHNFTTPYSVQKLYVT